MKIGFRSNRYKDPSCQVVQKVETILKGLGCQVEVVRQGSTVEKNGLTMFSESRETFQDCDFVLSLGGDGTFLNAVHATAMNNTPVAGINLGSLGFLAEIMPDQLEDSLGRLVAGEYKIEERLMLDAKVKDSEGKILHHYFALNDVVLSRGNAPRILPVELWLDNQFTEMILADGLMISAPTGSTGYSMAAGGPIVDPTLELMIVTPICPHSLHSRSYIISPDCDVTLKMRYYPFEPVITIDGQHDILTSYTQTITVERSDRKLRIPRLREFDFFRELPEKLRGRGYIEKSASERR